MDLLDHGMRELGDLPCFDKCFKENYPSRFSSKSKGIITPYKSQLEKLQKALFSEFDHAAKDIEVNTVDAFQGREVDVLVLMTVRANPERKLSFVADKRRMNVPLTRAKNSFWIVGNVLTLESNTNWAALVRDARDTKVIMDFQRLKEATSQSLNLTESKQQQRGEGSSKKRKNKEEGSSEKKRKKDKRSRKKHKIDKDQHKSTRSGTNNICSVPVSYKRIEMDIIRWDLYFEQPEWFSSFLYALP